MSNLFCKTSGFHESRITSHKSRAGFTLAELMIATTVLALLLVFAAAFYNNFFGTVRNLKAANQVYEESRFLMNRISKEIRNGTVDYEEYHNQKVNFYGFGRNTTFGQNYCQYSLQFYSPGPDGEIGTTDDESTGVRNPLSPAPLEEAIQEKLFLIDINGRNRTYIKRVVKEDGTGRVGLLRLVGQDWGINHDPDNPDEGQGDGLIDTWTCADGFTCGADGTVSDDSFVDISPAALDIVDLKFVIAPMDDPRKAYNTQDIQIQPHITIKLIARAGKKTAAQLAGNAPGIVLQSTISARAYNEIITKCNLKECIPGSEKACPKTEGVCGPVDTPAQQTCVNYIWPGCTAETYSNHSADYEDGSETASCAADNANCKETLCKDKKDNDCNGLTDEEDPVCKEYLCNDGKNLGTTGEACIDVGDVGSICYFIRPLEKDPITGQPKETSCFDGYDNDCDGKADQFDEDCQIQICNNGQKDTSFVADSYTPKNYLGGATYDSNSSLNESCIDVGGICALADAPIHPKGDTEISALLCPIDERTGEKLLACQNRLCTDGLDNDCDGNADEFDGDCVPVLCTNKEQNCDLAPKNYNSDTDKCGANTSDFSCTRGYLVPYQNPNKADCLANNEAQIPDTTGNEAAVDVGGICQDFVRVVGEGADRRYISHAVVDAENAGFSGTFEGTGFTITPAQMCADGLDNDADENTDWQDSSCCPNADGDLFLPYDVSNPDGTCFPSDLLPSGQPRLFDCNDSDPALHPDADEICDNAVYPDTYGIVFLRGQPVDNNCSFLNEKTSSAWDRDDPACCVDTDDDHFGTALAFIYKASTLEGASVGCYGEPTKNRSWPQPDCNDTDSSINPGAFEQRSTPVADGKPNNFCVAPYLPCNACFNQDASGSPVNDDCFEQEIDDPENAGQKITVQRANHIDWYKDKDAGWFSAYLGKAVTLSGISAAAAYKLYENDCCNLAGPEICDDAAGSDENCNGLEGLGDYFCRFADGISFFDNFSGPAGSSKPQHVMPKGSGTDDDIVFNTTAGTVSITNATFADQTVTSDTLSLLNLALCENGYSVKTEAGETPNGGSIRYQLSDDGGANWTAEFSANTVTTFHNPTDKNLRWRALLSGDGGTGVPILSGIKLTITCLP
ncbi:putative metal-binding motif-containing protein [Candidatus Peregrinibacteria bacterium]|nr:putative metal-binding motif-containing protein [Candidatus Peregrinibacteria bacterium]